MVLIAPFAVEFGQPSAMDGIQNELSRGSLCLCRQKPATGPGKVIN
jgi:hypothetical protein